MATRKATTVRTSSQQPVSPVLQVTRYDRVSAVMIVTVMTLCVATVWLSVVWATNRIRDAGDVVPLELIELPGGVEEGAVDETLNVESPEEETQDPSLAEELSEETEIQEMLDMVVELSDVAANQAEQYELQSQNTGTPGSKKGTGRRALGMGPGESGLPREQRWFVRFSDRADLETYAKQLDFFGIELGALLPTGDLVLVSNVSSAKPRVETRKSGAGEERLYMTWQGGTRRDADMKFFQKAGIDARRATILQFYPPKTETLLASLERGYRNRSPGQIRRTYFSVTRDRSGFKFVVTRQSFHR